MQNRFLLLIFLTITVFSSIIYADDIPLSTRIAAVKATATKQASCKAIGDFYWEIGDQSSALGRGSIGISYGPNSVFQLASSSKLPFAAYVLEKTKTAPSADQIQKMQMSAGYTSLDPITCTFAFTVGSCFYFPGNNILTPSQVGYFYYNDGHDNKLAMDLGLGNVGTLQLTLDLWAKLGSDTTFSYVFPEVVGGMQSTAAGYGRFLRKILAGQLRISNYIGSNAICTNPSTCNTSAHSPIPEAWHYSLNHWIEDDPITGDGAFSSVGLYGFYPWISADKKYYGILARQGIPGYAAYPSIKCGRNLRKAWITGTQVQ